MNDPKTIPKVPPATPAGAETSGPPAPKDTIPDAKEPFDPFKFQSITMPPGLRSELIEEARNRPPETAPLDTPPPAEDTPQPEGVTLNNEQDEGATIRIARKLPTERLPRVLLAHAQERRRRLAVIIVGFLAGFAGFAAVWSQRDADRRIVAHEPTPPGLEAAPATAARPSVAAPLTTEMHAARATPPEADPPLSPPLASSGPRVSHLPPPVSRPTREPSLAPRAPAPVKREAPASKAGASATNVQKPASNPNGVDLLDFEGPAPKGP